MAGPIILSGCGGSTSATPTLNWYQNPDNGGQGKLAQQCAAASNGAYKVKMQVLPSDATQQREQLVRRLAADDSSIDVMSLDVVYTAEFANAGFLRPFTGDEANAIGEGRLEAPMTTAMWDDQLYGAPFKTNAQLRWYRKSLAEAAGVDPQSADFTWDDMITAAESQGKTIAEQGNRYEGYMVWVNAVVQSAGGDLLTDVDKGKEARPGSDTEAGRKAAEVIGRLGRSSAAPPDLSTAIETQALAAFQSGESMFMLNWPYVLAAIQGAADKGAVPQSLVDDIGWARYPKVVPDKEAKPPLGGTNMAVSSSSEHPTEAAALVTCATSLQASTQYMLDEAEPSTFEAAFKNQDITTKYPAADLIVESIKAAGPRPVTPYYVYVVGSVLSTWHPAASVSAGTPGKTDKFMSEVLKGDRLL
jgi:multiple sugar transport system substrate-binding protein